MSFDFSTRAASYYPVNADWMGKIAIVGDGNVADSLSHLFRENAIPLGVIYDAPSVTSSRFGRDTKVGLLDGTQLIPSELIMSEYRTEVARSMIPGAMAHFMDESESLSGKGFVPAYRKTTKVKAEKNRKKWKSAKSCIEGGNCHLFIGSDGKPKAVIGHLSLILSYLALDQQGYFEEREEQISQAAKHNLQLSDPELCRITRNFQLALNSSAIAAEEDTQEFETPTDLPQPYPTTDELLSPAIGLEHQQKAAELRLRLQLVQEKIAAELNLPQDAIAYLWQTDFHIDKEIFPATENVVYMHSDQLAIDLIKKWLPQATEKDRKILESYYANAVERDKKSKKMIEYNAKQVQSIGCRLIPIAGIFEGEREGDHLNFMNGLFFNDRERPFFITNGCMNTPLTEAIKRSFLETIQHHTPQLKVLFANDGTSVLSDYLWESNAGLRCLTYLI
jgi:hypothetical protein